MIKNNIKKRSNGFSAVQKMLHVKREAVVNV